MDFYGVDMRTMSILALAAFVGVVGCSKKNNSANSTTTTADTTAVQQPAPPVTDTVVKTTTTATDTIHGKAADTTKAGADTSKAGKTGKHARAHK